MPEVNTAFPYRDGYVRADRADDYQPSPVAARAVHVNGTVIAQAHAAMENAQSAFTKHLDEIQRDRYSSKGLREQIANFVDTDAARAVDKAVEQVRQRRDQAQIEADEVRRNLSPSGDTPSELRATRYWNRTKGVLDTVDPGQLLYTAQDLIAKAERAELGTLLQELPAYVQARGQTTEWLDPAVAQVIPEYGSARAQLTKAQQACIIAEHNAKSLRTSFAQGRSATVLVDPRGEYDPDK